MFNEFILKKFNFRCVTQKEILVNHTFKLNEEN